jgi:DNA-directed RNA polymerase specialized sigma24 family protein
MTTSRFQQVIDLVYFKALTHEAAGQALGLSVLTCARSRSRRCNLGAALRQAGRCATVDPE